MFVVLDIKTIGENEVALVQGEDGILRFATEQIDSKELKATLKFINDTKAIDKIAAEFDRQDGKGGPKK